MATSTRGSELKLRALVALAGAVHRLVFWTHRCEGFEALYDRRRARGEPVRCIYAVWHGDLWLLLHALRHQGTSVMVSASRDGELITRVMEGYGYRVVRGSSSRGAARALLGFIRAAREREGDLAITVDGPRGPAGQVKDGIVLAAARSGLPIVPLGVWTDRCWRAGSWDRMAVGKPFARVRYAVGDPIPVPADVDKDALSTDWVRRVADGLDAARRAAAGDDPPLDTAPRTAPGP